MFICRAAIITPRAPTLGLLRFGEQSYTYLSMPI
jgi:hypothetical protein